ncbi:MAG: hypothetical protein MUC88_04255 [Planctomycetes bacterium]|jgi:hypothetical protein|nr:hypothetical protein [Planctomycetota bacterium]
MCYELYLSTSGSEDLVEYDSELVHFERPERLDDKIAGTLLNPVKWYIGSKSGCSCTFRHLAGGELSFDEPQDWFPEDEDNLKATAELYRVIAALVQGGNEVDCLDVWSGAEPAPVATMAVSLSVVSEKAFRLFENHHFVFGP